MFCVFQQNTEIVDAMTS